MQHQEITKSHNYNNDILHHKDMCFSSFHNHIIVVVSPALLIPTELSICMLGNDEISDKNGILLSVMV